MGDMALEFKSCDYIGTAADYTYGRLQQNHAVIWKKKKKRKQCQDLTFKQINRVTTTTTTTETSRLPSSMRKQIQMCLTQRLQSYKCQALCGVTAAVNYKTGSLLARTAGHISQVIAQKITCQHITGQSGQDNCPKFCQAKSPRRLRK
jgi:hypothetical protein